MKNQEKLKPNTMKKKWLKKLERKSWELELLLSGFSIMLILELIKLLISS